jgi:pimeloyl-ACP methyl ester carboxylesterase
MSAASAPTNQQPLHWEEARKDDQIVPVKDSAKKSVRLINGAKEIYYPGAPHGLTATHEDQVNADLLGLLVKAQKSCTAA